MDVLLKQLAERIKARNGMVVTSDVWEAAHGYQRALYQAHTLFGHGAGILTGLEVRAKTNQDQPFRVEIGPGIAIDPDGHLIVVEKSQEFHLDVDQRGLLYIYLLHMGETALTRTDHSSVAPLWVRDGYVIECDSELPAEAVELARVRFGDSSPSLADPDIVAMPQINEIDMRFRRSVASSRPSPIGVAIAYVGTVEDRLLPKFGSMAATLGQTVGHLAGRCVWFDDDVPLAEEFLRSHTLLYLIEYPHAQLSTAALRVLGRFIQNGSTVFVESYREEVVASILVSLVSNLELTYQDLSLDHDLLLKPFSFASIPEGARDEGTIKVGYDQAGAGLIYSPRQYGHLWQRGQALRHPPSREALRSAIEWCANLVLYAAARRHSMEEVP